MNEVVIDRLELVIAAAYRLREAIENENPDRPLKPLLVMQLGVDADSMADALARHVLALAPPVKFPPRAARVDEEVKP
jgi:hypothetical protein